MTEVVLSVARLLDDPLHAVVRREGARPAGSHPDEMTAIAPGRQGEALTQDDVLDPPSTETVHETEHHLPVVPLPLRREAAHTVPVPAPPIDVVMTVSVPLTPAAPPLPAIPLLTPPSRPAIHPRGPRHAPTLPAEMIVPVPKPPSLLAPSPDPHMAALL